MQIIYSSLLLNVKFACIVGFPPPSRAFIPVHMCALWRFSGLTVVAFLPNGLYMDSICAPGRVSPRRINVHPEL